uniref:Uncharacterized protein n=1 Tax=Brassica campestris TaxID=3711 RepID=A0A3P5YD60_BRACM|nr:unnamed protein product [Brassica rapa]
MMTCVCLSPALSTNAYTFVICAGVQENGKLPTENEPKIGLSLQNVRTVKVEGLPGLFRYRWCSYNVQWLSSSQFLSSTMAIVIIIEEEEK